MGTGLDIDHAYCISLRESSDRRQALAREWGKLNIDVEYLLCERSKNPSLGCSKNHQAVARKAASLGLSRVLIFEDDVRFYDIPSGLIGAINKFLDHNETWDIFYLGGILGKLWLTHNRGVARVRCAGLQSYILSERAYEKVGSLELCEDSPAADTIYKKILKAYCCFPMITHQEAFSKMPSYLAEQRIKEGGKPEVSNIAMWEETRRKQYWHAYVRYFHRWLFRLQQ